jgi:hypothetical protein
LRRHYAIIGLVAALLLLSTAVEPQSLSVAEFDYKTAERQLKDTIPIFHRSLHEAERAPDGTRGFELPAPNVQRVAHIEGVP